MSGKIKKMLMRFIPSGRKRDEKKLDTLEDMIAKLTDDVQIQSDKIDLKVYRSTKATEKVKEYISEELRRRDIWALKAAEVKRLACGRKIWVIKCPAPDSDAKYRWGDYSFSLTLKKYLENLGYYVLIECYEDWYCDAGADAVVVIRGLCSYHPDRRNEKCKYYLWCVSHPELISKEECELYDTVFVNSIPYAEKLQGELSVPVKTLLLCADTEIFYPSDKKPKYDRVFVGNSRGVARKCVSWCAKRKIPLHVWGNDWEQIVEDNGSISLHGPVKNENVADIYRNTRVVLNDHWDDMREYGFVNNRIMEALCCGSIVITDYSESYERIFGDTLLYYRDEEEFYQRIVEADERYEELRERTKCMWPEMQEKYSFATCAKVLSDNLEKQNERHK